MTEIILEQNRSSPKIFDCRYLSEMKFEMTSKPLVLNRYLQTAHALVARLTQRTATSQLLLRQDTSSTHHFLPTLGDLRSYKSSFDCRKFLTPSSTVIRASGVITTFIVWQTNHPPFLCHDFSEVLRRAPFSPC